MSVNPPNRNEEMILIVLQMVHSCWNNRKKMDILRPGTHISHIIIQ